MRSMVSCLAKLILANGKGRNSIFRRIFSTEFRLSTVSPIWFYYSFDFRRVFQYDFTIVSPSTVLPIRETHEFCQVSIIGTVIFGHDNWNWTIKSNELKRSKKIRNCFEAAPWSVIDIIGNLAAECPMTWFVIISF